MTKQRRTVGVVAAVVLALLGTLGLVAYVQGAKDDAVAGEKLVKVYVATGQDRRRHARRSARHHGQDREGPGEGAGHRRPRRH